MLVAPPSDYTPRDWVDSSGSGGRTHYRSNSCTMDDDSEYTPSRRPVTRRSAQAAAAAATSRSGSGSPVKDSKRVLDGAGSVESWNGIITTAKDALMIIEACRQGILPILMNRPKERERDLIRSGSIIVFMENQSGMKRWRDGFRWTPSRIATPFLIYRQLDDEHEELEHESTPRRINDMNLKKGGLIKKALSLAVDGTKIHMISYFTREDEAANTLSCPSNSAIFASIQIPDDLWSQIQHDAVGASTAGSTDSPRRRSEQGDSRSSISSASCASNLFNEHDAVVDPSMMQHHGSVGMAARMDSESMVSQSPELEDVKPETMDPFWVLSQVTNANLMGNMAVSNFGGSFMTHNGLVTPVQIPSSTSSLANAVPMMTSFGTLNGLSAIQAQVIPGHPNQLYHSAPIMAYQPIMIATPEGQPQQYGFIPVATSQPSSTMMSSQSASLLEAMTAVNGIPPQPMPSTAVSSAVPSSELFLSKTSGGFTQPMTQQCVYMQQQPPSLISPASSSSSSPNNNTSGSIRFSPYRTSPERYLHRSMDFGESESVALLRSTGNQRLQRDPNDKSQIYVDSMRVI
ncbi:hypothetical protein SeMB42_g00230 [Synchytrium endobioticum]|uniref:Uncharacterized protein n=1 Tax=Synchytrium endobioticum TaxID=286115 RepID=A0A507DUA5_9FUNG|nr:hypothetical protein SeMB42_g00230 [Synchytrium endobioticum]